MFDTARDGTDLSLDDSYLAVLGFDRADLDEPPLDWIRSRLHPDDASAVARNVVRLVRGEQARVEGEFRVRHASGEYLWVRGICAAAGDRLVGSIQDITTLRTEAERSEERFRALFENAPVMIDSFSPDGRCLLWNQACVDTLGYTREELEAAEDAMGLFYPDAATRAAVLDAVRAGDGVFREYTVQARSGPRVQRWANFVLPGGESISVGYDVTAERSAVERLQHAQRLAAIGTLAAGVAHEINNPTTYLRTNTEMSIAVLRRAMDDPGGAAGDEDLRRVVDMLGDNLIGVHRIQDIVRELGSFARVDTADVEEVDVNALAREAAHFAGNEVRHRAVLDVRLGPMPAIVGRPKRLSQVLVNLLLNASHAVEDGAPEDNVVAIETSYDVDARALRIAVSDTGCGIEPDVIPRLFEPFFTTRVGATGTGLGLALAFETVRDHGGRIDVASEPGRGSVFTVVLPRDTGLSVPPPRASSASTPAVPAPASRRREKSDLRVLVIDDEELVRQSLLRVLEFRYVAEARPRAADALTLLAEGSRFDVVLCDVMMPGIDGRGFYERLAAEFPDQLPGLVFMTGGAVTERARAFIEQAGVSLLYKPVGVDELFALVESVGNARGA